MKLTTLTLIICTATLWASCGVDIKNREAKVEVEEGTEANEEPLTPDPSSMVQIVEEEVEPYPIAEVNEKRQFTLDSIFGYWVGYFRRADSDGYSKSLYVDEGFIWDRENKINISIDQIKDSIVIGHSVVAENDRPFQGTIKWNEDQSEFTIVAKEPGDDKYDGIFEFSISDWTLTGQWTAYKDIDIKNRKYSLEKKAFKYNPDIMLEKSRRYVDWSTFLETKETMEFDEVVEEWMRREFASATELIYEINASNTLLKKDDIENLKRGDLTVIRNTIYARHGYSFKNRPLRVFFDAQSWYIPVHTDIKSMFTNIEKQNIKLLLKYEENASEYYDYFGRG